MRKYIIILLSALILFGFNKKNNVVKILSLNDEIKKAKFFFDENKDIFEIKSGELEGYSSESGKVIGFYNKGKLCKLEAMVYGEMGKVFYEAFILSDKNIFFVENRVEYNKPIYEENSKIINEEKNEYILDGKKVFIFIKGEKVPTYSNINYNEFISDFIISLN